MKELRAKHVGWYADVCSRFAQVARVQVEMEELRAKHRRQKAALEASHTQVSTRCSLYAICSMCPHTAVYVSSYYYIYTYTQTRVELEKECEALRLSSQAALSNVSCKGLTQSPESCHIRRREGERQGGRGGATHASTQTDPGVHAEYDTLQEAGGVSRSGGGGDVTYRVSHTRGSRAPRA